MTVTLTYKHGRNIHIYLDQFYEECDLKFSGCLECLAELPSHLDEVGTIETTEVK